MTDRHLGPVGGELLVRGGVHRPADALDGLGELARVSAALGALEQHVLQEMRDPGDPVVLYRDPAPT